METSTNDLVVRSMGHCFLCLNQILIDKERSMHPNAQSGLQLQSFSIHSLQNLSRLLRMDLGKVFNNNDLIPQHLLDKVRKSKLKGELCNECALLNDEFSKQYMKLEKIKMEMMSSLRLIQAKLLTAMETDKSDQLQKLANSMNDQDDGWMGKLDILEILRSEAIQRCSQKICADAPRPKVQKLTIQQVITKRQMYKLNSVCQTGDLSTNFEAGPDQEIGCRNVTTDFDVTNRIDADDNIYPSDNLDDFHCSDDSNNSVVNEGHQDISDLKVEDRSMGYPVLSKLEATSQQKIKTHSSVQSESVLARASESGNIETPDARLNPETGKYKCSLCPREFTQKWTIKTHHESVHLGIKYKCSICGIEFTQRSAFNLHHRTIHLGVRVKCRGCNKIFKRKDHLIAHQRKHCCRPPVTKTDMIGSQHCNSYNFYY